MAALIFYVLLAILVSFLCSIMEAVLLSVTPSYVTQIKKEKPVFGRKLKKIKDEIESPLAAILSLNTIAHTIGAAGAGAQAAYVFGDEYLGVISGVLTLLILVFSEILPKTIGALYWKKLLPSCVALIRITIITMWPLVKMSKVITHFLSNDAEQSIVSRKEMLALNELGFKEGVFDEQEFILINNLFKFRDLGASHIMTPRTVIFSSNEAATVQEFLDKNDSINFSRIPVYKNDIDQITGYVLKTDIYETALKKEAHVRLADMKREIHAVPEWTNAYDLFEDLIKRGEHIALLVDEYGGTAGVITLEDIIETMIGFEIVDEKDAVKDMQIQARLIWNKRAKKMGIDIEKLNKEFKG